MLELKKEMSNFLTKEEAEFILNRRNAIIDPGPYRVDGEILSLRKEIDHLRQEIYFLRTLLNKQMIDSDFNEPTI